VPRHLLTRTQRDSDLIPRERDPGIGPRGTVIHDMILLSHRQVRDPEHDTVVSGSVGSLGPVCDADEVGSKWDSGARDHIDTVRSIPTRFPALGTVPAYFGTIVSVRGVTCNKTKKG
jgi:hypothetical protein